MLKSVIAVVVGVIVGVGVIFLMEGVGHMIYPPPEGTNLKDPEALKSIMRTVPLGAKVAVVLAWFTGILAGGMASLAVGAKWAPLAWVVAGTLFAMAGMTMLQIPHPNWMIAGAVVATLLGGFGAIKLMGATYAKPAAKLK